MTEIKDWLVILLSIFWIFGGLAIFFSQLTALLAPDFTWVKYNNSWFFVGFIWFAIQAFKGAGIGDVGE